MKKLDRLSVILAIIVSLGGIIYSAASLDKDVKLLSANNEKLETKVEKLKQFLIGVNGNSDSKNTDVKVEIARIQADVRYNKALLSELNKEIQKTNELMLESINDTKNLLLTTIDRKKQ